MKKRDKFLLVIFSCVFLILALASGKPSITGETVTGKATSEYISMNITVIASSPPTLSIISPENKTYLSNSSLLVSYSASNEGTVWYNLDNTNNVTISIQDYFNTSQGSHTLFLYANNSFGTTSKNVTFFVNSTRFIIIYEEFKTNKKGNSTDFDKIAYEDIQDVSNIILENTDFGKIKFNEPINLTNDKNNTDNILDIDSNADISFNRIEIDSGNLPNFNKQSSLELYNLSFTNPRILKNGEVCSSTACIIESYPSGTLKFNVTGFSVYSAEETPSVYPPSPPSGGGGGPAKEVAAKHYSLKIISPGEITLFRNKVIWMPITIQNIGEVSMKGINLSVIVRSNNMITDEIRTTLAESYIEELKEKESQNLTMFIGSNTNKNGRYRATVYADVQDPQFSDSADFYIELKDLNESDFLDEFTYAEEIISGTPKCLELEEMLKEAKRLYDIGQSSNAIKQTQAAITACLNILSSQKEKPGVAAQIWQRVIFYTALITLVILLIGIIFYVLKKIRFNKLEKQEKKASKD